MDIVEYNTSAQRAASGAGRYQHMSPILRTVFALVLFLLSVNVASAIDCDDPNLIYLDRVICAKHSIRTIKMRLELFKLDNIRYPTEKEGLHILVRGNPIPKPKYYHEDGYLQDFPIDPWGHPYIYRLNERPEVFSTGADGQIGGDGENKDIYADI